MDPSKISVDTFNKRAIDYQDKHLDSEHYRESYVRLSDLIVTEDAKVLDVACGPGTISRFLLTQHPKLRITGVDLAPKMIELAKTNVPTGAFHVLDGREIGTLSDNFDVVVCGFYLPYINDKDTKRLIQDANKLLVPNGILHLSLMEGRAGDSGLQTNSYGDRAYIFYREEPLISTMLDRHGFETLAITRKGFPKADGKVDTDLFFYARRRPNQT